MLAVALRDRLALGCALVATLALAGVAGVGALRDESRSKPPAWGLEGVRPCYKARRDLGPTAAPALSPARQAEVRYRALDFAGAAAVLRDDPTSAVDHAELADRYEQLGRAYQLGTDPASEAVVAYHALLVARSADLALHRAWVPQIEARLGQIAKRAAVHYLAHRDRVNARFAVADAERFDGDSPITRAIRAELVRAR